MAQCSDIVPLLSSYNDAELTPLETEQVSHHLDKCESCRETLLDFVLLGHQLRAAMAMPATEGFVDAVMSGIGSSRRPLRQRLRNWLEQLRERWVAAVSLGGAAVATAALVLVLAEPQTVNRISWLLHPSTGRVQETVNAPPTAPPPVAAQAATPFNSQTYISRLEARHPSVATWSEPDFKTTVIWLGDDASGNE